MIRVHRAAVFEVLLGAGVLVEHVDHHAAVVAADQRWTKMLMGPGRAGRNLLERGRVVGGGEPAGQRGERPFPGRPGAWLTRAR